MDLGAVVLAALLGLAPVRLLAQSDRSTSTAVADAWITTQIHAKFFADTVVKGRNIDVDTSSGVVTLAGHVYSEAERQKALAHARDTSGVTRVIDKLTLAAGGPSADAEARDALDDAWAKSRVQADRALDRVGDEISDGWITTKIQSKYFLDATVKGLDIDVTTENGVVSLTGSVTSPMERLRAIELATATDGVKKVLDRLAIR
jgi:osmotically-inducible protein OsmY